MNAELGREKGLKIEGKTYKAGIVYMFDELPASVQKLVNLQEDEIRSRFNRDPRAMDYELKIIPYEDLEELLHNHFGDNLQAELSKPAVEALATKFEREGVTHPAAGEEGWDILLAAALVGEHVPYFRVIEPLEEIPRTFIPTLEGRKGKRRRKTEIPEDQALPIRLGFWRMLQRIHRGIPGFAGSGNVFEDQFVGGLAGVKSAWVLLPDYTAYIDAVPIAGFYSFGTMWPKILRAVGVWGNASKATEALEAEFGIASDKDLRRGTIPHERKKPPSAGLGTSEEPVRIRPWGRCGNTLFWRTTPHAGERPVVAHINPVDIVEVVVDQKPLGLPEGAILISRRRLPEQVPHGWSPDEFYAMMMTLPPILSMAVDVWFGWMEKAEAGGSSRHEILNRFARIAQGRKNAILSGLQVLLEMPLPHPMENRMLVVMEGSPAHQDLVSVEAAAQITDPTVVAPETSLDAVVDEILSSFGVMECG